MAAGQQAFGLHAVAELLRQQPDSVTRLLLAAGRGDQRIRDVVALAEAAGIEVQRLPRGDLDALASGRHQGVVAELRADSTARDLRWSEAQLHAHIDSRREVLLLILDGVTDPHNLGACLRSADAAGVDALITPKDGSADITPVVRKVACGAAATVPLVRVTNLARSMDALKERGVWLYGAAGEAQQSLYACEFSGSVGLVMGAEGRGLRRLTRERCDLLVSLPMAGAVSSLNVSVATGVCLFEILRQRQQRAQAAEKLPLHHKPAPL
ncbi:MAG: 23S rRNA (guanosine(2251)-2'-O)-methyltransferase RlmB [Halieaceae bacterium]|jgi:23S rRNA (guanosine2251-2'-O)-methyltransferase|nr:23S rRNA (guanosine(2251)-2'-O)-methyltransferase RlmB [Halieaceae bacterium]